MKFRPGSLLRGGIKAHSYSAFGALFVLIIVMIVYMESRADLNVWALADLDEEFTEESGINTFEEYLALEERLFKQLDELVYAKRPGGGDHDISRYSRGGLSDRQRWSPNWNRSFVLPAESPKAAVLLHGMSDSPYSLHSFGERLNEL